MERPRDEILHMERARCVVPAIDLFGGEEVKRVVKVERIGTVIRHPGDGLFREGTYGAECGVRRRRLYLRCGAAPRLGEERKEERQTLRCRWDSRERLGRQAQSAGKAPAPLDQRVRERIGIPVRHGGKQQRLQNFMVGELRKAACLEFVSDTFPMPCM